jgi:hypothetical protein
LLAVTVALASTPMLANVTVGLVTLYGARLTEGDFVQVGGGGKLGLRGRVKSLGLLEISLISEDGHEVRVAHLTALLRPLTVMGHGNVADVRGLFVEAESEPSRLVEVLERVAKERSGNAIVRLTKLAGQTSCAEIVLGEENNTGRQQLLIDVGRALSAAGLTLVLVEWRDVT